MISFPLYLVPKRISASEFTAPDNSPSAEQLPVMAGMEDLRGRGKHRYVRMQKVKLPQRCTNQTTRTTNLLQHGNLS